ncbi:helix-turn-helix transcriptional regulator [Grimontia sp. S25]|uniref:Helix-turn-helix transcriptional regulator n=1 Tax=Grimontia sedimenti TaxID=2711294 RepID=A0A6M1R9U8_9GAMM|nr:helix-turn-helix transcriptional regulator [Grimontia sedimenti]
MRDLLNEDALTFKDFMSNKEKISSARLSERLKKLEEIEAVSKENHPTNKKVFFYKLTQKGRDLAPVILDLLEWGSKHLHDHVSEEDKLLAKELSTNREAVVAKYQFRK